MMSDLTLQLSRIGTVKPAGRQMKRAWIDSEEFPGHRAPYYLPRAAMSAKSC